MIVPDFLHSSGDVTIDRRYEYARLFAEENDFLSAIDLLEQTLSLKPDWAVLPFTIGKFYKEIGNSEQARSFFEKSLTIDPEDHQGAALELERLGVSIIEDAMPAAFVATLFDQYATRFDEHLLEGLDYNVPHLIEDHLKKLELDNKDIHILDLGCGTGLVGEMVKNKSAYLKGVDLSEGMLTQASHKNVYDDLVQAELVDYLTAETQTYDLIIAADVLSYFAALDNVFDGVRNAMSKDGIFIFTVQKLTLMNSSDGYSLGSSRRFSHHIDYLTNTLCKAKLKIIHLEEVILRQDEGQDVEGYLVSVSL